MKTLYLCGAGNPEGVRLALTVNRKRPRWEHITILDDDSSKHGRSILGVEVTGSFAALAEADRESSEVCNLVARTTSGRQSARVRIEAYGIPFASLLSPEVDLTGVELASDVTVYQNATIGPHASIEKSSVVFIGGVVGHGSRVGPGCVVGPNAVLNARVEIGEGVYVGTNATVLPEVRIGPWATIGAGSVAVQDVPPGATVMGVPGEILLPEQRVARAGLANRRSVEETLAGIWAEAIGRKDVGLHDSFFEIGGTSLCMMQIANGIQREFGVEITLRGLFESPTIAQVARIVREKSVAQVDSTTLEQALQDIEQMSEEEAKALLEGMSRPLGSHGVTQPSEG